MADRILPLSEVKQVISISLVKSANDIQKQAAATLIEGMEKANPSHLDTFTRSSTENPSTYTP